MRISDWSSDVCSSDLFSLKPAVSIKRKGTPLIATGVSIRSRVVPAIGETMATSRPAKAFSRVDLPALGGPASTTRIRSEEHTSELQTLMRNSYAVFCLKQKNKKTN